MPRFILVLVVTVLLLAGCGQEKRAETVATDGSFKLENDFTLKDLQGNDFTLSEQKGLVVLDFWATWCPPCRAEIPVLQQLHDKFHDKGLTIVGISNESSSTIRKFIDQMASQGIDLKYTMLLDKGGKVMNKYGIQSIPSTYFIGKDGRLLRQETGFSPELVDEFHKLIENELK